MQINLKQRWLKPAIFVASLVPLIMLINGLLRNDLGANPVEEITHRTGEWALRFLLLTLATTPLRRLLNLPDLIRFRRMLGLFAFAYACLHLLTWLWLDKMFSMSEMWDDVVKRRFITAGMAGFLAMVPLALTSTSASIRFLGGRRWQLLHRLAYVSAAAGVLHYWWLVKSDIRAPAFYGMVLAIVLALRLPAAIRKRRRQAASHRDRGEKISA